MTASRATKERKKKPASQSSKGSTLEGSIMRLIWQERRISRAEIARRMGLSRSTVTEITKETLGTGLVTEGGTGHSSGGRRPRLLEFNYDAGAILGVDIGASHVSVAITDLRGREIAWREKRHPVRSDPEGTRKLVVELCDKSLEVLQSKPQRLVSICVALPSPVDPMHPEWLSEVVIPAWRGQTELSQLQDRYRVPVYVDNDANLGALGEHRWGIGRSVRDMLYVKIAYGVGAGYIFDGELYRGGYGVAGEIGHIPLDPQGKQCVCGLRGCLATVIGAEALVARAGELLGTGSGSSLDPLTLTIGELEHAALEGNPTALRVIREAIELLSVAVVSWVNLLNPSMIVFGGSLAQFGEMLLEPIRGKVRACALVQSAKLPSIQLGALGPRAVSIGAATLAMEKAFDTRAFHRHSLGRRASSTG